MITWCIEIGHHTIQLSKGTNKILREDDKQKDYKHSNIIMENLVIAPQWMDHVCLIIKLTKDNSVHTCSAQKPNIFNKWLRSLYRLLLVTQMNTTNKNRINRSFYVSQKKFYWNGFHCSQNLFWIWFIYETVMKQFEKTVSNYEIWWDLTAIDDFDFLRKQTQTSPFENIAVTFKMI